MDVGVAAAVFLACALAILVLGVRLTRAADAIAAASRYGRGWVGFLPLSSITSLPELVSGLTAAGAYGLPNIAVGDVLGSLQFNGIVLAAATLLLRVPPLREAGWDRLGCLTVIGLLGLVLLSNVSGRDLAIVTGVGVATPLLLMAHPALARYQMRRARGVAQATKPRPPGTLGVFAACAVGVVAAAVLLPLATRDFADGLGLSRSVAGTWLLGAATSLPEVVVTVSALRLGAVDLAVADIIGSNLFDLLILGVDDLVYPGGPILAAVSRVHAIGVATATGMHALLWWGLRSRGRLLQGVAPVLVAVYAIGQACFLWAAASLDAPCCGRACRCALTYRRAGMAEPCRRDSRSSCGRRVPTFTGRLPPARVNRTASFPQTLQLMLPSNPRRMPHPPYRTQR